MLNMRTFLIALRICKQNYNYVNAHDDNIRKSEQFELSETNALI